MKEILSIKSEKYIKPSDFLKNKNFDWIFVYKKSSWLSDIILWFTEKYLRKNK